MFKNVQKTWITTIFDLFALPQNHSPISICHSFWHRPSMLQPIAWLPGLWCHDHPQPTPFPFKSLKLKDILLSQPIFPSRMLRALKPVIQDDKAATNVGVSVSSHWTCSEGSSHSTLPSSPTRTSFCHGNRTTTVGRTRWQASTSKKICIFHYRACLKLGIPPKW